VVLVPCLAPQALTIRARVHVPRATTIEAALNGQPLAAAALEEGPGTAQWSLPADALFRGDNVLQLRIRDGGPVFFDSLSLSAAGSVR